MRQHMPMNHRHKSTCLRIVECRQSTDTQMKRTFHLKSPWKRAYNFALYFFVSVFDAFSKWIDSNDIQFFTFSFGRKQMWKPNDKQGAFFSARERRKSNEIDFFSSVFFMALLFLLSVWHRKLKMICIEASAQEKKKCKWNDRLWLLLTLLLFSSLLYRWERISSNEFSTRNA